MTTVRCIDTETTGLTEGAGLVELAAVDVDLDTGAISYVLDTLVNPGIAIEPGASAVHHITSDMLAGAPTPDEAIRSIGGEAIYCAHNARFDRRFLHFTEAQWICSYKCALRAWPEAPSHANQTLRYWLNLKVAEFGLKVPPHRALHDACVTAALLLEIMKGRTIDRLIDVSNRPGLLPKLTFGKHVGKKFSEVDLSYLEWMCGQDFEEDEAYTARYWIAKRKAPEVEAT